MGNTLTTSSVCRAIDRAILETPNEVNARQIKIRKMGIEVAIEAYRNALLASPEGGGTSPEGGGTSPEGKDSFESPNYQEAQQLFLKSAMCYLNLHTERDMEKMYLRATLLFKQAITKKFEVDLQVAWRKIYRMNRTQRQIIEQCFTSPALIERYIAHGDITFNDALNYDTYYSLKLEYESSVYHYITLLEYCRREKFVV